MPPVSGTNSKYSYRAYGLEIHSEFELPELLPSGPTHADINIRLGKLDESLLQAKLNGGISRSRDGVTARASNSAITFHWTGVGTALVQGGRDVIIEPENGFDEADLAPYINGSILAVLLHQRGLLVLHASAVAVDGKAVAFLGEKGAGKSTLAAFMQNRGHTLLTDDILPVAFGEGHAFAVPGFPQIRLWADSVESIGVDPQTLPTINRFINKRSFHSYNFSDGPVELSRIYILDEADELGSEELKVQESFIEIVRNCYLGCYVDATGQTVNHFGNCSRLANSVPVYKLTRPHDFSFLSEVSRMIEQHS